MRWVTVSSARFNQESPGWDDDPDDGANSAPTTAYFIAYVSSVRVVNGDANSVSMRSVTLAIDSNVVLVDALNHVA